MPWLSRPSVEAFLIVLDRDDRHHVLARPLDDKMLAPVVGLVQDAPRRFLTTRAPTGLTLKLPPLRFLAHYRR